jgi:hypothetical protein
MIFRRGERKKNKKPHRRQFFPQTPPHATQTRKKHCDFHLNLYPYLGGLFEIVVAVVVQSIFYLKIY